MERLCENDKSLDNLSELVQYYEMKLLQEFDQYRCTAGLQKDRHYGTAGSKDRLI